MVVGAVQTNTATDAGELTLKTRNIGPVILLGPPGAGKGTQAQRLRQDFGLPYIATGDMFRAEKEEGTELGREVAKYMDNGDLVPDDLTIRLIMERINSEEAKMTGITPPAFTRNGK